MNFSELENQLAVKKKTIAEIADLLALRTDQNPNFSLLLGAGCSITSGITSAETLVRKWRADLCNGIVDADEQRKYLKKNHPDWYDPNREYSSLFEKKFDLQRHRRMFVEREVAGKMPSIGYAFLTSLVKANYFHTMFTTNFDDLINEAFYLYSDQRPIVCAHDSSINSVTVTSSRPKVIKLHGDYLFDDIKATARETESLEQNMKAKFAEFAKDFGLIVVGYSGSDRSIMDILAVLLKNDAYLKNGIYWCLRRDSEIGEDLKKLLWKEKVFFVEIDGFDELFAEIHAKVNDGDAVPISTLSLSRRPTEIISKLLDSTYLKGSKSPIIRRTYEHLLAESKRTTLMDLVLPRDKGETTIGEERYSDDEMITRLEIEGLVAAGSNRDAIDKGRAALRSITKPGLKREIYRAMVDAHLAMNERTQALGMVDELIEGEPYVAAHYLLRSDVVTENQDRLNCIKKAIEVNPHWYRGHYRLGKLLSALAHEHFGKEREGIVQEALNATNSGLEKDPSIDNPCWWLKYNILATFESDKKAKANKIDEVIEGLCKMDPDSILVYKIKMERLSGEQDKQEILKVFEAIDQLKKRRPPNYYAAFDDIKLSGLGKTCETDMMKNEIEKAKSGYELAYEPDLTLTIAKVMRRKLGAEDEAIRLLQACYKAKPYSAIAEYLIDALTETGDLAEAEVLLTKATTILSDSQKSKVTVRLLDAKGDFEGALQEIRKREAATGEKDYTLASYYLLKQKHYADAAKLTREVLEKVNFSFDADVITVNYELARKKQGKKCDEHRLGNILKAGPTNSVKAAVYALLGKKQDVIENVKAAVREDQTLKYDIRRWPVMEEFWDNPDFRKLVE